MTTRTAKKTKKLTVTKTQEFTGIVSVGWLNSDNFERIFLEQEDGYKVDLLGRLTEATHNYGSTVTVRYWLAGNRQSKDDLITGFLSQLDGALSIEFDAEEYAYSEYTYGVSYSTALDIGKHNLFAELKNATGKYLHLEIDFIG